MQVRYFRECPLCYQPLTSDDFMVDPYRDDSHAQVARAPPHPLARSDEPHSRLAAMAYRSALRTLRRRSTTDRATHTPATLVRICSLQVIALKLKTLSTVPPALAAAEVTLQKIESERERSNRVLFEFGSEQVRRRM